MKNFLTALYAMIMVLPLVGCGGSTEEQAPPSAAPEMSTEEKANYEKQMKMMMDQRKAKK
jgi:predicted small lipoprotein YifL